MARHGALTRLEIALDTSLVNLGRVVLQTTNLGVRSSNLFGRASHGICNAEGSLGSLFFPVGLQSLLNVCSAAFLSSGVVAATYSLTDISAAPMPLLSASASRER